jgi:hypothetical protein
MRNGTDKTFYYSLFKNTSTIKASISFCQIKLWFYLPAFGLSPKTQPLFMVHYLSGPHNYKAGVMNAGCIYH